MLLIRNVILQKKVLSVLVQVILLQSLAYCMQILDKPDQKISLLAEGADVNAKDRHGLTALHRAVSQGNKEVAELLTAKGADINSMDNHGLTALHYAVFRGHKEIAELLIAKGANANTKDSIGSTALHLAVYKGHKETAELLINNDADINARDNDGSTALHIATRRGHKEIAELFQAALLAQALMRLSQKKQGMILLTDLRLWLHIDYPIVGELQKLADERKSLLCSTMQNKPLEASSQTPAMLLQEIPLSIDEQEQTRFGEKYTREFNGLALDAEGLEALITASMVKTLEEELKCPIHGLFDCIVGTSFGGIVALGLAASKEGDCPLLGTNDLIKFFENYHKDILSKKLKIKNESDSLKQRLSALFKGSRLSDALT